MPITTGYKINEGTQSTPSYVDIGNRLAPIDAPNFTGIPKISDVNVATTANVTSELSGIITTTSLATALSSYVKTTTLADYVTAVTLAGYSYVTSVSLTNALSSYVTITALDNKYSDINSVNVWTLTNFSGNNYYAFNCIKSGYYLINMKSHNDSIGTAVLFRLRYGYYSNGYFYAYGSDFFNHYVSDTRYESGEYTAVLSIVRIMTSNNTYYTAGNCECTSTFLHE